MKFEKVIEKYEDTIEELETALDLYDKDFDTFPKSFNPKESEAIRKELKIIKGARYRKITNDSTAVKRIYALTQRVKALFSMMVTDPDVKDIKQDAKYKKAIKWENLMANSSIKASLDWVESEEAYAAMINDIEKDKKQKMYSLKKGDSIIRPGESWTPIPKQVFKKPAGLY